MKENINTKYTSFTYKYITLKEKLPIMKQNLRIFFFCYRQSWVYVRIWAVLPTHLNTALSRMSQILVRNSCTSETGITSQSEPCREVIVSTNALLLREISCSVPKVAWAAALMLVRKLGRLISLHICKILSDVIWWWRHPEPKCCWMIGKKNINLETYILPASGTGKRASQPGTIFYKIWC